MHKHAHSQHDPWMNIVYIIEYYINTHKTNRKLTNFWHFTLIFELLILNADGLQKNDEKNAYCMHEISY